MITPSTYLEGSAGGEMEWVVSVVRSVPCCGPEGDELHPAKVIIIVILRSNQCAPCKQGGQEGKGREECKVYSADNCCRLLAGLAQYLGEQGLGGGP